MIEGETNKKMMEKAKKEKGKEKREAKEKLLKQLNE